MTWFGLAKPSPEHWRAGRAVGIAAAALLMFTVPAEAQSLKGSSASLTRQNRVARAHDFSYLSNGRQVREFADQGYLVRIYETSSVELAGVSYPYARPEVKLFIERLGRQYEAACGEELVVTSLTRPWSAQPANASDRSVHPTGMAIDLRLSKRSACRRWLDNTLLSLERQGLIEATRERRPPHYHVAVFPEPYRRYVAQLTKDEPNRIATGRVAKASVMIPLGGDEGAEAIRYKVRRGDTLWDIARRNGTSVAVIKEANNLRSGRIHPGEVLTIPAR